MKARSIATTFWTIQLLAVSLAAQEPAGAGGNDQLISRFETILQQNPRRGTALDRVYGHHAQNGTLDELVSRWRERAEAGGDGATAWMLVGLFESRRGNDAVAIEAFGRAEEADDQNPYASFYLAESLRLAGQLPEAAQAYRRTISRQPPRAELLEIYRLLGRTLQRSGREQEALGVWQELEEAFPGDIRVAEQIASALAEDGNFEAARARFEALAEASQQDLYKQVTYQVQAADLTRQLGDRDAAIGRFEQVLVRLNPDSWLHKQVRTKIEGVFRSADDLAGLAEYYVNWLNSHPEDTDAMAKAAKVLSALGRTDEAEAQFTRAIELAPSQTELRQAYINQLVYDKEFAKAATQYWRLSEVDPNNPDVILQWGLVLLQDNSLPDDERRDRATDVWMKLIEARPDDPVAVVQVADLLRQAEAYEKVEELYRQAVELRPQDVQYHEYLGEFLHARDRKEEAVAAWQKSAEGDLQTPENLHRLAEVFRSFGYAEEALDTADQARKAEPDEMVYHWTYIDLLLADDRFEDAKTAIREASAAAEDLESRENLLQREVRAHEGAGTIGEVIAGIRKQLDSTSDQGPQTAELWLRLARFLDADRQRDQAIEAVERAVELDSTSIAGYRLLADYRASAGALEEAVDAYRRLASIDAQFRSNYLREISRVQARLGRIDEALQAGKDLLAAAPGNAEHLQFYADLCFQLGRAEEALETLRRAVRTDPSDADQLLRLAGALVGQFQTAEAIELYWQAFDKAEDLRDQLTIVSRLADLHIQQNQFENLIHRLERTGRQAGSERTTAFCVAQAHLQAEDYFSARNKLAAYLNENEEDTLLLEQLSRIAEQEGDLESAIDYQERLVEMKNEEGERRKLAQLLLKANQAERAETLLAELALQQDELHRILDSADELLTFERYEAAEQIIDELARRHLQNWEVIYRQGVVAAKQDEATEAVRQFQNLLDLSLNHDETTAAAKALASARPTGGAPASTSQPNALAGYSTSPLVQRVQRHYDVRREVGLDRQPNYARPGQVRRLWMPGDFGVARMAALGWLVKLADQTQDSDLREQLDEQFKLAEERPGARVDQDAGGERTTLRDALYFALVTNDLDAQLQIAREMSESDDVAGPQLYLMKLMEIAQQSGRVAGRADRVPDAEPLPKDQLDHMLTCYHRLEQADASYLENLLMLMVTELGHAGRKAEADELLAKHVAKIKEASQAVRLTSIFVTRGDVEGVLDMMRRARSLQDDQRGGTGRSSRLSLNYIMAEYFSRLAAEEKDDEILEVLMVYLDWAEEDRIAQSGGYRPTSQSPTRQGQSYVYMYSGGGLRSIQLDFPPPTAAFDEGSLTALRNAYEYLQQHGEVERLMGRLEEAAKTGAITHQLASAYVQWWIGSQADAVETLETAVRETAGDEELRFQLAQALLAVGDLAGALEELDQITALDQSSTIRRETAVLGLAMQTGAIDRAREAAERLFGLRLDSNQQLQLAQSMHQLGMHEMADSVLRRIRQTSRGASNDLVNLMTAYQQQGKKEEAVQIAHQVLRSRPSSQRGPGQTTQQDRYRQQALQVIATLGDVKQLIADTEEKLDNSPNSARLLRQLADYYQADKQTDKARAIYERLAELGPDDARSRLQAAQMLEAAGNRSLAVEQYLKAFRLDPSLFDQNANQIVRTFQQDQKLSELAKVLLESDLTKLSQPYYVINFLQRMMQEHERGGGPAGPRNSELALDLFDKLWEAHPQYRSSMLTSLGIESLRKSPRAYKYARERFLDEGTGNTAAPWQAFEQIMSWSGDGMITSAPSILLDVAEAQQKLGEIESEIIDLLEKRENWPAGEALLGLVALRRGKVDQARSIFDRLLEKRLAEVPPYAAIVLGHALEKEPALIKWAARLYEQAMKDTQRFSGLGYEHGPEKRLVHLYKQQGRLREARELLSKVARAPMPSQHNPEYDAYQWLQRQAGIGSELADLGFPLDALYVVNAARADKAKLQAASQFGGGMEPVFEQAAAAAKKQLTPEKLVEYFARSVDAMEGAPPAPMEDSDATRSDASSASPTDRATDLLIYTKADSDNEASVASPIGELIDELEPDSAALVELGARLAAMSEDRSADRNVHVVLALVQMRRQANDANAAVPGLEQLLKQVDATQLTPSDHRRRPSNHERERAREWLGLWLVARKCLADIDRTEAGRKLAQRALAAAVLLRERELVTSMLRESGNLALARGDKESAEKHFQQLLHVFLGDVDEAASFGNHVAVNQAASFGNRIKPIDFETFQKTAALAELATKNDMHELSLACIRRALRGGPPIPAVASNLAMQSVGGYATSSGRLVITQINRPGTEDVAVLGQESLAVAAAVTELDDQWKRQGVPAESVYETLAVAVLPEGRENEIFLYTAGAGGDTSSGTRGRPSPRPRPQSFFQTLFGNSRSRPEEKIPDGAALRLIRRAIEAGKATDLQGRVAERAAQPLAALPAHVLLAQLGMESGDAETTERSLDWLSERLARDRQPHTIQLTALAAVPALQTDEHFDRGAALVEKIAAAAESHNDEATAQQMKEILSQAREGREKQLAAD